jgi:hypothetical protein
VFQITSQDNSFQIFFIVERKNGKYRPVINLKKLNEFVQYHHFKMETLDSILSSTIPVRIRVRIDPPHPLVCRKRRLNGAVLRMRPEKPRPRVTAGVAR